MSRLATTAEQRAVVKTVEKLRHDPLVQMGAYLDAANAARLRLAGDPQDQCARDDYNFAVARIVETLAKTSPKPGDDRLVCPSASGEPWQLALILPNVTPQPRPAQWRFTPTDRLIFRGPLAGKRAAVSGLGAPVVAAVKDSVPARTEELGLTASVRFSGRRCDVVFADPMKTESLTLDRHTYVLAADFQAPLAMSLSGLNLRRFKLRDMFRADLLEGPAKLARLEPYERKKIPVLFIHGLGNSPAIFAPLISYLRSDPKIRRRYQFWAFGYPTGLPYPMSAAILRYQLDKMRRLYPDHKDIVVVGHSMGGMISRLLLTDSKTKIWNTFFDRPPGKIPFAKNSRDLISRTLIFDARADIERVVFVSASHRGSDMATSFFGRLGATLVGNPVSQSEINKEVYSYMRQDVRTSGRYRLPNSIEMLDPDNTFLKTANGLPIEPGVPFHSLIGDRGRGGHLDRTKPSSSDGVVPYWSSHMDGARSERIIPSGHWSQLHPQGMREIKRVLLENLR